MLKKYFFFLLFSIILFSQCVPVEEKVLTDVNFDLSKSKFQRFYDLQDKQIMDSLLVYIDHKDPSYRYAVAMAYASIKDSTVVNSLAPLLEDEVEEVRTAAAYAMGQLGSTKGEKWLIKNFQAHDSLGIHNRFNATILEAMGKCGSKESLYHMSTTKEYIRTDTLLLEGMANGIYQFGLRGHKIAEATERMINFLLKKGHPNDVRLIAANYLYRMGGVRVDSFTTPLLEELYVEKDPHVRMALASGLAKTKSIEVLGALLELLRKDRDYKVKCNIIRALGNYKLGEIPNYEYRKIIEAIAPLVNDKNIQIATTAANYFLNHGTPQGAPQYRQMARNNDSLHWQVKTTLLQAANRYLSPYSQGTRLALQYELKNSFTNGNVYEKAAALRALGEYGNNYREIYELGFKSNKPAVRTACLEALSNIAEHMKFGATYNISVSRVKKELGGYFKGALEKGDAAMMAIAAGTIKKSDLDFKSVYLDSLDFLTTAKNRLEIPKETETLYEILKAIDFFNGKDPKKTILPKPEYNHPINWRVFNTINEDTKAEVKTSKGTFVMKFFPKVAPGSVTNFVTLAKSGFFDKKTFHRVISNFVAQGGCPRGDGYGSLDYTIRSEVGPLYYHQEGMIGMASAGKHTEGVQWFITFTPTPHLNGKYSIFAQIVDGMDVVHQLTVGDVIQQVQIVE